MMIKRFLRFRHAAIRRHGDKRWTASDAYIEFNPMYVVSVSVCEKGITGDAGDVPMFVELSNGTKFLCFIHEYGEGCADEILTDKGEAANRAASEYSYSMAADSINILNRY